MRVLIPLLATLFAFWTAGCSHAGNRAARTAQQPQSDTLTVFPMPDIPVTITDPEARADYLTYHYWDRFNFADTTLISRPEITEQGFVDFISVLPYAPAARRAVDRLFEQAAAEPEMLYHFISLCDLYLYDPNSPMRNEELYLLTLRALTESERIGETDKLRPRALLQLVLRNRPGEPATDFEYTLRDGRRARMSDLKGAQTLLFFNDPDCQDCQRVKRYLQGSPVIRQAVASGQLTLLALSVEGATESWRTANVPSGWVWGCDAERLLTERQLYDLKAMPTLYLLDAGKRVILKDASVETIEAWLQSAQE